MQYRCIGTVLIYLIVNLFKTTFQKVKTNKIRREDMKNLVE